MVEYSAPAEPSGGGGDGAPRWSSGPARLLSDIATDEDTVFATGIGELDRVMGGGLVPGSVTLMGGEPGIGKSTIILQLASSMARLGKTVLYVSAEESAGQLRNRAERLGMVSDSVYIQAETALPEIMTEVERLKPDLLLIDSIQTVSLPSVGSVPGSLVQVRECAQALVASAKHHRMATILVGHVTKEGNLAGPRTLEHLVDTVLSFEGDRNQGLRFLRAAKNRFGSTLEPGVLEMTGDGLVPVEDPSGLFLADRRPGSPGSVVVPVVEGHRPMLVELQALVVPTTQGNPRRSVGGVDSQRLALLLAVLERRASLAVLRNEVYVSLVGGIKIREPGVDLGIALAVASATTDLPVPDDMVACGEIGLAGEIRQVGQLDRRLEEAARLGYRRALVPASVGECSADIDLIRVSSLHRAISVAGLLSRSGAPDLHLTAVQDDVAPVSLLEPSQLDEGGDGFVDAFS